MGDLFIENRGKSVNARLFFEQGPIHRDYLYHLFDLFKSYCSKGPKEYLRAPNKLPGKSYSGLTFKTYSLPCFQELHSKFYQTGVKQIPANIEELITPLSLAYWICDDGGFNKRDRVVVISTQSFSKEEVNLLISVLNQKFGLNCTINKNTNGFVIRIPSKSLPILQALLKNIMPGMMVHKIGL